jgi:hypothetical protein
MEVTPKMIQNLEARASVIGPFGYMIDLGLGGTN